MGAGKTTLLEKWSKEWQGESGDLDHLLAEELSIKPEQLGEWILKAGWDDFRAIETRVLKTLLEKDSGIYSLGGGAFHRLNRGLLEAKVGVRSIFVETDIEECWRRVSGDPNRPLASAGKDRFIDLYKERVKDYQIANYSVSGDKDFPALEDFCKKYRLSLTID